MALQIGRAFRDGLDELLSGRGAVFVVAFVVYGLLNAVITSSFSQAFVESILRQAPSEAQVGQLPTAGEAPLAFDIPLAAAGVGALVLYLVGEALTIVAIRAFAGGDRDVIPSDATRRLGRTVAVSIAAAIVTGIAVVIGLVFLVIPGLVLAVLFYFVKQEIALNDSGVVESVRNSIGIVRDNFVATAVLAVVIVVLGAVAGSAVGLLPLPLPSAVLSAGTTVVSSVFGVFGIAVTTLAYLQVAPTRGVAGAGALDGV